MAYGYINQKEPLEPPGEPLEPPWNSPSFTSVGNRLARASLASMAAATALRAAETSVEFRRLTMGIICG